MRQVRAFVNPWGLPMSSSSLLLIAIAVALFLMMYGLEVVGYRRGRKCVERGNVESRDGLGVVEGAVFALLGLILAFQFSGAASRLGDRRHLAIQESNAIGTAYLRLDLLGADDVPLMRGLFRQYLDSRIHALEAMPDLEKVLTEHQVAEKLQQEIWSRAVASCKKEEGSQAELLLLPALNEMFDIMAERKAVGQTHAPILIQIFLIVLALIGAVVAGNAMGRSVPMPRFHMLLFAAVTSLTIFFIIDMEYPRIGFIRIGAADQSIYELRESMR